MTDTCEHPGCTNEAVGYLTEYRGAIHPRACRTHADTSIVFQKSYGYTDRDEAETHVRDTILEAMDALNELAEFDGIRGEQYRSVAGILRFGFDAMRRLAEMQS